jgi:hypothetical protein
MKNTSNLGLPQWEATDPVQRADFNDAFQALDSGYADAVDKAGHADSIASVAYTPDNKPYVVGSYTGTGKEMTIELGFRPSFVVISGTEPAGSSSAGRLSGYHLTTGGNNAASVQVTFTDTGFRLTELNNTQYPNLFYANQTYDYIAFR